MNTKTNTHRLDANDKSTTSSSANALSKGDDEAQENRGQRAPRSGSGAVTGSGAGAGGGGNPEEYDNDLQV